MSTERVSYVPNQNGRFVRYSNVSQTSSNRLLAIVHFFTNIIIKIFQLTNILHCLITKFNNMLASLPFFIRHFIHAILALCLPFYSFYQSFALIINRIQQVIYPIHRTIILITRIFTYCITLPMRIIRFIPILLQSLLKNLLIILILAGIFIGLLVLLSNEKQFNYMKSYVQNTTNMLLKRCSMI